MERKDKDHEQVILTLLLENKKLKEDNVLLYSDNEKLREKIKELELALISDQ